jgi:hypothetical protein
MNSRAYIRSQNTWSRSGLIKIEYPPTTPPPTLSVATTARTRGTPTAPYGVIAGSGPELSVWWLVEAMVVLERFGR